MPLPTSKLHTDWLSLIEISGPFLSLPVLTGAFPQGLDELEDGQARSLRADFEFWQENAEDPAVHSAWIKLVLESLLGYGAVGADGHPPLLTGQAIGAGWKAEFPEHEETIRPDMMLVDVNSSKVESQMSSPDLRLSTFDKASRAPHLLIQIFPPSQDLNKAVAGSRWQASAATRMMELLHATEVPLGLLTNGEQWMLVNAPKRETTGFATWYAGLWFDEPLTLRAFRSLLGVQRFFGVAEDQTLESLLKASANDQLEITDQLGLQVRHAVEILIQMIDRADQDSGGALLGKIGGAEGAHHDAPVQPALLYEAALTVMMRLVFLLSAEERKLLPLDEPVYAEFYAVSTLRAQLREMADLHGEEVLERRFDAWSRLLAIFRAVHGGIRHERLNLLPYGGSLFDPDKYPFLEGRTGSEERGKKKEIPLPVNNRTVLHLLDALQMLQVEGEARRLSFRALDVEQIGHVYEGLLDHQAVRAGETMIGLKGAKRLEPEVSLSELEQQSGRNDSFLAWLKDCTGRSDSALKNAAASDILQKDLDFTNRLRSACGNDDGLFRRVSRFAGLIRLDDFGFPVVILAGSVYVTSGTARRATGTHYTPRMLTEPVVKHTLEPLVYVGPAEGLPREQWRLRAPEELLDLKICDMAMGSGGFLVQVVRYLAERLVESWSLHGTAVEGRPQKAGAGKSKVGESDFGLSTFDKLIYAQRLVAERCVYGVDKNPLAVEIAKLSLWLVTLAKFLPFSFLDHALKCGDSLVGASEDDFLRWAHGYQAATMTLFDEQLRGQLETARAKRRELESFVVRDVQEAERKAELLKEAEAAMAHIWRGADLLTGARLLGLKAQEVEDLQVNLLFPYMAGELDGEISPLSPLPASPKSDWGSSDLGEVAGGRRGSDADPAVLRGASRALAAARKERAFHWEFAFPEVFERGGFSAFVGNPPFIGGKRISIMSGDIYAYYLRLTYEAQNTADLAVYFFLRAFEHLKSNGTLGLIATNTISQGDTRESGLDRLINKGGQIYRALPSTPWPGAAAVSVSIVHMTKGVFLGKILLNDVTVEHISSLLDSTISIGNPEKIAANSEKSFIGIFVRGIGFVLDEAEAASLLQKDRRNADVIRPYLVGADLNSRFDQSPSRYIVDFSDWPLDKAEQYPDCLSIVRERVYPERQKVNQPDHRERWWQFANLRPGMKSAIAPLKRVLVISETTKNLVFAFMPTNMVFSHMIVVIATDFYRDFSILQSNIHETWVWKYASTLETRLRYTPTDCFETFPFPRDLTGLEEIGERYHETRREIMLARQEGLTKLYNRFHDPEEHSEDIVRLRELHVEMDEAVARAYGWGPHPGLPPNSKERNLGEGALREASPKSGFDLGEVGGGLALGHGFHETPQGIRFTISESARREVLSRLLKLNHERWEEEQKEMMREGEKEKKAGKTGKPKNRKTDDGQMGLF
jgi:hypothetical protein